MKVAIIGAGISGLTCAHELERLGVKFDIFERRDKVGEIFSFATCGLNMMTRPIKKLPKFIANEFNIRIEPMYELKRIIMKSKNHTADIKGKLGSIFLRGQDQNSFENQLYKVVKTEIQFDTFINIKEVQEKYDKIIVATGDQKIAKELQLWNEFSPIFGAKLHRVVGKIEPNTSILWYNTDYAKTGYTYLMPFDESSAYMGMIVPNTNKYELENLWGNFCEKEKIPHKSVETYDVEFHIGYTEPLNIGDIYFTGNAGGFVEPLLGCGQLYSMWSGVLAARSIANGLDYNSEIQKVLKKIKEDYKIRKALSKMNNDDFDKVISIIGLPIVKNILYNTNVDFLKYLSYFLKE